MPGMRVHELAKEFNMTSKEMLDLLAEMKIPAKTHATPLKEESVEEVRKKLSPEIKERAGELDDAEAAELAKKKAAQKAKKKEEEAARRAAVEAERKLREEERARREGVFDSKSQSAGQKPAQAAPKQPEKVSAYQTLADQIEAEKARVAREKAEAAARARAAAAAAEVAKKRQVEESLRQSREHHHSSAKQEAEQPVRQEKPKRIPTVSSKDANKFSSLLDQIEAEKNRMKSADNAKSANGKAAAKSGKATRGAGTKGNEAAKQGKTSLQDEIDSTANVAAEMRESEQNATASSAASERTNERNERTTGERGGRGNRAERAERSGGRDAGRDAERGERGDRSSRKKNRNKRGGQVQMGDYLDMADDQEHDRYAQMAAQAEKLQRDKVLAEARAAVAAAASSEGEGRRKKRKEKRVKEAREKAEQQAIERGLDPTLVLDESVVEIPQGASVSKFAELIGVQPNEVIKRLFMLGQALTLTQSMSDDLIELIADDLNKKCRVVSPEEEYAVVYNDTEEDLKPRPPVVTVMGHVDHGKTSLLDAIRHSGVAAGEAGGITQHIGASVVNLMDHQITFIDTPGHEAFTAMRARGAQVTDVIILVVAADDGVMPQTIEAINHAKAANVPIVVAVNKIDKDGANPDRVRQELTQYDIIPEEWGGQNMFVNVSAKKNLNVDELLETVLLQADVLGLRANPDALASGFVIEANLDKGRGPVATVLVQRGTLKPGDTVVAGTSYGRVRALINPKGEHVKAAGPSYPVEILGLNSVPTAGDEFRVFEDERDARKLAEERALRARLAEQETKSHMSLDDLFNRIEEGKQTDLNLIIKADVQGSIEALRDAFNKMDQSEVKINIVHAAVGGITETDVTLAAASDAIIIGFNVRPTGKSKQQAEKEKVDIRLYRVIYQALEDINAARVGLLKPDIIEKDTGIAEVRDVFRVPKVGNIAGCYIIEGELSRDDQVRVVREGTVIFEGVLSSLKRFKDDVKSVKQGYECGIGVNGYQDIKVGDTIEGYRNVEVERTE